MPQPMRGGLPATASSDWLPDQASRQEPPVLNTERQLFADASYKIPHPCPSVCALHVGHAATASGICETETNGSKVCIADTQHQKMLPYSCVTGSTKLHRGGLIVPTGRNRPPSTSGRAPSFRPPSPFKHLPEPGFPRMRLSECSGELIMPGGQSEPS